MNLQAIILDFDGTIVESVDIKDWGWEMLFKEYHHKVVENIIKYHHSDSHLTRYQKFRSIYVNILKKPYNSEIEQELDQKYNQLIFERIADCPFVLGAKEFLEYFYIRYPLYIVTVNPADYFQKLLERRNLTKYFNGVYTADWSKRDALKDIVTREKCGADEAIYIGDTIEDYKVASAIGIFFIGRHGNRPLKGIEAPVFDTLVDVQRFICKNIATSI